MDDGVDALHRRAQRVGSARSPRIAGHPVGQCDVVRHQRAAVEPVLREARQQP